MPYSHASAAEIDKKLRDDFRRRIKDFGISAEITDPVLAVLFRTFAQQLEQLYTETDRIRLSLFDELIMNLSMEARMARPAQTVVRFHASRAAQVVAAGTELVGQTESGERLTFLTDATIAVSPARIAFGLSYQDGALRLLSGVELPESLQAARPSMEPVRVNLGPNPCIFLAFDNLSARHLNQHSLYFELGPDSYRVQQALKTEPWCIADSQGDFDAKGILRPCAGNGGIRSLQFLITDNGSQQVPTEAEQEVPLLPTGFYGPRTFLFPVFSQSRRLRCKTPRAMDAAVARIFGRETQTVLTEERAWIRISMPPDIPPLHTSLDGILLHAVTASNVECSNQTIEFDKHGRSIPITQEEGGAANYLVAPLSIFGESGAPYIAETEPSTKQGCGRYSIRNGRIDLHPGRGNDGTAEAYANLRLWVTHGKLGNSVGVNKTTTFLKGNQMADLRISNPTSAAGGTDCEQLGSAQARFAEALLSRDRVVTLPDLINVARAFDNRILAAKAESGVRRTEHGLKRLEKVTVMIRKEDFLQPLAELPILQDELLRHLTRRLPMNTELTVHVRET